MSRDTFEVLFVGTGVSTGIPCLGHVLRAQESPCLVCDHALRVPTSKNRRNNVSIALTYQDKNSKKRCILIDAGKTMRDACMKWFPQNNISQVHGLVITHGHADAMLGLDDVRDLQTAIGVEVVDPHYDDGRKAHGFKILGGPMPIYLTKSTMETVQGAFPYLASSKPSYLDEENCILDRRIALLDFRVIDEWAKIENDGLTIQCFPVYLGGKYVSLGFSIGKPGEFVYISDVKVIPQETWYYLKSLPRIKILVIDALDMTGIWSHCGIAEAIEIVQALNPVKAYFTGISCGMGLHDETESEVQIQNPSIFFSYDGMRLQDLKLS